MNAELVQLLRSPHERLSGEAMEKSWDYTQALGYVIRTPAATRIAEQISLDTMRNGHCSRSHNELAALVGISRRAVFKAMRKLLDEEFVTSNGRAENGAPIYRVCWERGAEYRQWAKAYDREFERARKAMKVKSFKSPPYPKPSGGAADVQEAA